ncbi:hypothetical protein PQB77_gp69 [Arthrobacter phage Correa]|uniref:Uncharacterized protein n=3 Tax=Mudcatvirus TaxID=1982088 RepID=A0A222ZKU1_9CAUD|nr:hypothetical protein PQB75_gp074 [Arthrobacter phage Tribby]YP_010666258.1 hypothetical protein PQB76_gp071 [Arthrobacter phage Cheesy]YP_010666357.1 hypothetical protein PQB77_gp69 [Arthrobacter phage Correa]ASR80128.1 hypothetical protein SEA_CORREA_69 [Arthrobacter phage Correa]ASR80525.1 hypothetical protein SEA_TRIBBY_74 [Arthrobacter phage Tribby]ASR84650.1 hypothetical protein SEA_CHEESY_71 [Arthrobacter phage Cheesy]
MTITQQYHRKPEPVEAVKISLENVEEVASWCGGNVFQDSKPTDPTDIRTAVVFPTLMGGVEAPLGFYLVKNAKGAFSKVSASAFEQEYNVVETPSDPEFVEEEHVPAV